MQSSPTFALRDFLIANLHKSTAVPWHSGYVDSLDLSKLDVKVTELTYGPLAKVDCGQTYGGTLYYVNDTEHEQSKTLHWKYEEAVTASWTVTKSIQHSVELSLRIGPPKGMVGFEASYTLNLQFTESYTKTESVKQIWEQDDPVIAPPHTKIVSELFINKADFACEFTFTVEISGKIRFDLYAQPMGTDPNISLDCEGEIANFMAGLPSTPELAVRDGKVYFTGTGTFKGLGGISINIVDHQYSLQSQKKLTL
jgi:hypothetical protein